MPFRVSGFSPPAEIWYPNETGSMTAGRRNLRNTTMSAKSNLLHRITLEAGKCGGRPCIRSTRMRVVDVLELLSAGASFEEIVQDYPTLEREDILAAIEYAARQTDHVVLQSA